MFPINSTDRLIFVNINNSYEAFINNRRTSSYFRESLYDCTVKYWVSGNLVGISINLCKSIQKELFINDTP